MIGLSPTNDDHIINVINEKIAEITYYYYPHKNIHMELQTINKTFEGENIKPLNVVDFWNEKSKV